MRPQTPPHGPRHNQEVPELGERDSTDARVHQQIEQDISSLVADRPSAGNEDHEKQTRLEQRDRQPSHQSSAGAEVDAERAGGEVRGRYRDKEPAADAAHTWPHEEAEHRVERSYPPTVVHLASCRPRQGLYRAPRRPRSP